MFKVLHVLYQSYPNISGSSTRSKSIVDAMYNSSTFEPIVITSPLQKGCSEKSYDIIDGVSYYRTFKRGNEKYEVNKPKSFFTKLKKAVSFIYFTKDVYKVSKKYDVDVIHAHAMAFCGVPALIVARLLGKKFVYEIRSDWHLDEAFSSGTFYQNLFGKIELYVASKADSLVVISAGLFEKYSKVNPRTFLISNAVHDDRFTKNELLLKKNEQISFGFIGSLIPLEGLELVLDALKIVKRDYGVEIDFFIAGKGESVSTIIAKSQLLGITKQVHACGSFPFESVDKFYDSVDVIVNFRRDEEIAHTVTPLKPLEAMAQKKLVIVSDVRGMLELVTDKVNGLVVPAENVDELADTLYDVYSSFDDYNALITSSFKYVLENYSWNCHINKYVEVYK
ncbi:glycosyltransferase family 4 protein [Pseudoalteromonas sp. APC 3250]|uniref:glycosyltransferase family 4 protein n=1 Tax=Pseudoalteromonas sp. APC 3250 TaxID=3035184 RepID=UPI0025B5244F|nr:glycosyltransferase family 4 protein [Pseudoalteromonas sp. APC 3250]MDN3412314.1 glycosyltransferase family 4 protein [Pseudoalteromonas sp. APC 3250]